MGCALIVFMRPTLKSMNKDTEPKPGTKRTNMHRQEIRLGLGNFVAITKSRLSGKTFVPNPHHAIYI
jgi:hypothetical protein